MNEETITLNLHIDDLDLLITTLEHLDSDDIKNQFVPGTMSEDQIDDVYENLERVRRYLTSKIG